MMPKACKRVGCEAFASDLNPVACLILKVMLEDIPRHGPQLAAELRRIGAEIPLVRSFWPCKKTSRKRALRHRVERRAGNAPEMAFEVFEPTSEKEVPAGTVGRAKAACMACGTVLPPERVGAQLSAQRGGADVVFDPRGRRTGGARLAKMLEEWERGRKRGPRPVPDEPTPAGGGSGAGRAFSVQRYGMLQGGDLFTARQKVGEVVGRRGNEDPGDPL